MHLFKDEYLSIYVNLYLCMCVWFEVRLHAPCRQQFKPTWKRASELLFCCRVNLWGYSTSDPNAFDGQCLQPIRFHSSELSTIYANYSPPQRSLYILQFISMNSHSATLHFEQWEIMSNIKRPPARFVFHLPQYYKTHFQYYRDRLCGIFNSSFFFSHHTQFLS